jgi:hypothetical protein
VEPNHKVITLPDSKFIGKEGGTIDTLDIYDKGITARVNDSWPNQKTNAITIPSRHWYQNSANPE